MTKLITADFHLNDNPRDEYRHEFIKKLPALARKVEADQVIILGDLTDQKDEHPARLVNRVVDHLHALAAPKRQVTILRGNHDYLLQDWPFFAFTKYLPDVQWINQITSRQDRELFLPHTNNHKQAWKDIKLKGWDWIFTHNTFTGAKSETDQILDGIPLRDTFPAGTQIVSGDIHVPQSIEDGGVVLTYVGAPYTIDFGDEFDPRVVILEGHKMRSLRVEGPRKRLLEINSLKQLDRADINAEDICKVRVHLAPEQATKWWELRDQVYQWGERAGVIVNQVQPIMLLTDKQRTTPQHTHRSDEELLRAYCKRYDVDDRTLGVGLKLLEQD